MSFRCLLFDGIKSFRLFSKFCDSEKYEVVFFENMWQWKVDGYIFDAFAGYYLEGHLFSHAKSLEKISNE